MSHHLLSRSYVYGSYEKNPNKLQISRRRANDDCRIEEEEEEEEVRHWLGRCHLFHTILADLNGRIRSLIAMSGNKGIYRNKERYSSIETILKLFQMIPVLSLYYRSVE